MVGGSKDPRRSEAWWMVVVMWAWSSQLIGETAGHPTLGFRDERQQLLRAQRVLTRRDEGGGKLARRELPDMPATTATVYGWNDFTNRLHEHRKEKNATLPAQSGCLPKDLSCLQHNGNLSYLYNPSD